MKRQATVPRPPTFWELAVQATSSTRQGYQLLAPHFERTAYATPEPWIEACLRRADRLFPLPSETACGGDLACGTGRGLAALRRRCSQVEGFDFSPRMLEQAARRVPDGKLFEADLATLNLPRAHYHRLVTFGAWGHILPPWRDRLLVQAMQALRPDGVFLTITADAAPWWCLEGGTAAMFDATLRLRNALLREPFHMYYRLNDTATVIDRLQRAGASEVRGEPVPGSPHRRLTLVIARPCPATH